MPAEFPNADIRPELDGWDKHDLFAEIVRMIDDGSIPVTASHPRAGDFFLPDDHKAKLAHPPMDDEAFEEFARWHIRRVHPDWVCPNELYAWGVAIRSHESTPYIPRDQR